MDSSNLEVEKDFGVSFEDPISKFIFEEHIRLLSLSKGHFCLSFGNHDSQYHAVDFLLSCPEESLAWLHAKSKDLMDVDLNIDEFRPLVDLIDSKYFGKAPSKNVKKYRVMLLLSVAHDVQCFLALEDGEVDKAIRFHNLAELFFGMYLGCTGEINSETSIESIATKGADSRHLENRAMKADVFVWLDENFGSYSSMDSAAEAIAGKVVPIKFRAVRSWVGQWKKVRSAGKT